MIKIKKVNRQLGDVVLTFEYDKGGQIFTQDINAVEIIERMKALKALVGRTLTLQDLKSVIVTMINQIREGKTPLLEVFPYENYIGVDLE